MRSAALDAVVLLCHSAPSISSKKVSRTWGVFRSLSTFLEGIWSPREGYTGGFHFFKIS